MLLLNGVVSQKSSRQGDRLHSVVEWFEGCGTRPFPPHEISERVFFLAQQETFSEVGIYVVAGDHIAVIDAHQQMPGEKASWVRKPGGPGHIP
jgi:hypothetical protein